MGLASLRGSRSYPFIRKQLEGCLLHADLPTAFIPQTCSLQLGRLASVQIRGSEFPEQLHVGACCAGSFWAGYRMCSWQHWLTSSPPFPWNPHLGISWQHHQLKLRSPCPWALCGTQLSPGLVEPLPQFPLCETRCHLSATLVSSTFGPRHWWPRPRSFLVRWTRLLLPQSG